MKNKNNVSVLFMITGLFILLLSPFSCTTSSVPVEILVPAEINVNKNIKHVGIINRSLPSRRRKIANLLEGFISGESILADRSGAENCISGLSEQLNTSPRFSSVIINGERLRGTGTRKFPLPLNWRIVEDLCRRYRVDAIIALETFDSNIHFDVKKKWRTKKVKVQGSDKKKKIKVPIFYSYLEIDVNSGWRIYDPKGRSIIDMNIFSDRKSWDSSGVSRREAIDGLPDKRDAINLAGFNSGMMYGMRISPTWININRDFYVKGDPGLKKAKKFVRIRNWDRAIAIWRGLLLKVDNKIAGRAAFNLAFAYEIMGDFNKAYSWAKKSYYKFGNKRALKYMSEIRDRITDKYLLEKQLEE